MDVANDIDTSIKHQLIFGDLNTVAHGVARLSPNYCCDNLRWKSLGWSEAQWWNNHVFHSKEQDGPLAKIRDFKDPFDVNVDITLSSYRGWYKGKLDWTLVKGFNLDKFKMFGNDFAYSDHRGLLVDLIFSSFP